MTEMQIVLRYEEGKEIIIRADPDSYSLFTFSGHPSRREVILDSIESHLDLMVREMVSNLAAQAKKEA